MLGPGAPVEPRPLPRPNTVLSLLKLLLRVLVEYAFLREAETHEEGSLFADAVLVPAVGAVAAEEVLEYWESTVGLCLFFRAIHRFCEALEESSGFLNTIGVGGVALELSQVVTGRFVR